MQNGKQYDLPSGAKLFVSVAEYEKVMALHDALADALRGGGAGSLDVVKIQKAIEATRQKRMAEAAGKPHDDGGDADEGLNIIVDKVLAVAGSARVKAAIFACSDSAVYMPDGTEMTSVQFQPGTPGYGVFDNQKCLTRAREDFYDIAKAIAEENLRPFGKALFSMFMAHVESSADTQGSNTAKG